jgi:hypothetical protein
MVGHWNDRRCLMRWVVKAEWIQDDGTSGTVELGALERGVLTTAADVGLRLEEAKPLMARLQALFVQEQLRRHS